jgi:hypothetical protein
MNESRRNMLPANERRPHDLALSEPGDLAIRLHIPLTGRRALIRNTLIGSNLLLVGVTLAVTASSMPLWAGVLIVLGGVAIVGGFVALSAWVGQRWARRFGPPTYAEMAYRTNWPAVLYAGAFAGQIAALGLAITVITVEMSFGGAALITLVSYLVGGMIGGGLTALIGGVRRWLRRGDAPPEERLTISIS